MRHALKELRDRLARHALVIGKFYPPHNGHHHLIDTALAECGKVTVLILWSEVESISEWDRARWLEARHSSRAEVISVQDEHPTDYSDAGWAPHMALISDAIQSRLITHVYSSEPYGEELARRLSGPRLVEHVMVDQSRTTVPISASEIRADIRANWDFLAPDTKAGLCKRIVVCGAESTGTTTLAKALAEHYRTTCVPEYGRHFDWAVGKHHTWTDNDFTHIAFEQKRWEDNFARHTDSGLLICDTDEFATAMFQEVYLGTEAPMILAQAKCTPADLYIVTDHEGVPFEDDGTRFNSGKRPWMTDWFIDHLPHGTYACKITKRTGRTILVSGDHDVRMAQATTKINLLMRNWFHYAQPLEYAT
jgi:HTH-type transcriptional repressor of NAD biosynthesis genes